MVRICGNIAGQRLYYVKEFESTRIREIREMEILRERDRDLSSDSPIPFPSS